jgi:hypothetical protein
MSDPHSTSGPDDGHGCGADPGARCNDRKERVLHTRISEQLAEDIRRVAQELRMPTSNLVRNVLEEAFSALETVSDHVGSWLEEAAHDLERIRQRRRGGARDEAAGAAHGADSGPAEAPPATGGDAVGDEIVAWQAVTLNGPLACGDCARKLVRGDRAHLGLTAAGPSASVLCLACFESRFGTSA